MNPANILVNEHRLIEQVLNCLERMAEETARRGKLDAECAADSIAFFQTFVHGWHFPREEAYLALAMDPESARQRQDLRFQDHQRCREHLLEMEQAAPAGAAGDRRAAERFVEHAHAYIAVLMKHNEDEEDRVYPMVERALTEERKSEALRALRHTESQVADRRGLDACIDGAHRLADRFNVAKAVVGVTGKRQDD